MIHISILSYSLNSIQKHLKQFLEKVFVKITQFRVYPSSVSIDYTLLLGARRSCGQYQLEYFNCCEIFVIALFIKLELLFELCLSGGFTITCMGNFLLINHLNHLNHVNHLKLQSDQSLSITSIVILQRIRPIHLD